MKDLSAQGVIHAFNSLSMATRTVAAAMERLNRIWQASMESYYLRYHPKLPGSVKTERLRKKRISRVREFSVLGARF